MLSLHIACNDHANGLFNHRAESLNITSDRRGTDWCELEARNWSRPPRLVELEDGIRLAGKTWLTERAATWVGNWCWNQYVICNKRSTVLWTMTEFVIWLRSRGLYQMTMGHSELFQWFNDPEVCLAPVEIHELLGDLDGLP